MKKINLSKKIKIILGSLIGVSLLTPLVAVSAVACSNSNNNQIPLFISSNNLVLAIQPLQASKLENVPPAPAIIIPSTSKIASLTPNQAILNVNREQVVNELLTLIRAYVTKNVKSIAVSEPQSFKTENIAVKPASISIDNTIVSSQAANGVSVSPGLQPLENNGMMKVKLIYNDYPAGYTPEPSTTYVFVGGFAGFEGN